MNPQKLIISETELKPVFKQILNQRIVACWILVYSVSGEPFYTGTNLMSELMFIPYYTVHFLFYLYVAHSNSHVVGSVALKAQLGLPAVLRVFGKASTYKPLTENFGEKAKQNFPLEDICA